MRLIGITVTSIVGLIEKLQKAKFSEPIYGIDHCDHKKLESSLKTPFLRPQKASFIEDFIEKGALLFFLLIQNHCFENANKRIATATLITYAQNNNFNLGVSEISLYGLSMAITYLSKYGLKKEAVFEIENMLRENIVKIPEQPTQEKELKRMYVEFEDFMLNRSRI